MNLIRIIILTNFIHSNTIKFFNNGLNKLKFRVNLEYI